MPYALFAPKIYGRVIAKLVRVGDGVTAARIFPKAERPWPTNAADIFFKIPQRDAELPIGRRRQGHRLISAATDDDFTKRLLVLAQTAIARGAVGYLRLGT
jgi:hypothetical protein